jgi:phage-related protein
VSQIWKYIPTTLLKGLHTYVFFGIKMWKVTILPVAEAELRSLPKDMQAKFARIRDIIQTKGLPQVHEPYIKHLEGSLWEMRLSGQSGIARAIYVTAIEQRVVVVRVFVKKTQRTPPRELKLARMRAKEIA